jgi:hypothetical protein
MAKGDRVQSLPAVKALNEQLRQSKKLMTGLTGQAGDLGAAVMLVAEKNEKNLKYSKENQNIAKTESKLAKGMLGVLKARERGSKIGILMAKAKLGITKLTNSGQSDEVDILNEQYQEYNQQFTLRHKINNLTEEHKKALNDIKDAVAEGAGKLAGWMGLGGGIFAIFEKIGELSGKIGKEFGAIGQNNEQFKADLMTARTEAVGLGKGMDEVLSAAVGLNAEFGFTLDESVALASSVLDTSMALGLSDEEGGKLLGTLTKIGGMSFESAENFAKQTALLAEAEGVSPTAVMKDMADSAETIAKFTGETPEHLAKAAIQANKLGLSLNTIGSAAEGMLDFQSSLNAEIEAGIMLGRDVNLQKARELALSGKLDEFAVEITKQVGSQAEFEKMNVLQKKSLAQALGMEVSQLSKVVMNQDKVRTLGEAISEQEGLESMIGEESMDNIAKIVSEMKVIGAQLIEDIGPTVMAVAEGIGSFVKGLSDSKALLPGIKILLGFMAAKSLITAVSSIYSSFAAIPFGVGIPLGLAAVGTMLATIGTLSSFQGLESGKTAMIEGGAAIAHQGESITHTKDLSMLNKKAEEKLDRLVKIMDGAFGFGGTAPRQIGSQVGSRIEEIA